MRQMIYHALYSWGQHTLLTFKEVWTVEDADIKISFQKTDHFDSYPFDNKGGSLAHAFYPPDGRVHLDISEADDWNDEKFLFRVLLHEFGHTLGLGHNPNMTKVDIMFPMYMDFLNELGPDDIAGIQFLYGSKANHPTTTPITTSIPTTKIPILRTKSKKRKRSHKRRLHIRNQFKNHTILVKSTSPIIFILNRGNVNIH